MFGSKRKKQDANFMAPQYLKTVNDCANLVNTTKNPDVFFMRWDLMIEKLTQLSNLQMYVDFKGTKPNVMLKQVKNQREQSCRDFLQRYSRDIETKIYSLKTENAKVNKVEAFHEKLIVHYEKMPQSNIDECELEYYRLVAIAQPELKLAISQIQADNCNKLKGSVQMKYCTNCGNELNGGKFCSECGTSADAQLAGATDIYDLDAGYSIYGKNKIGLSSWLANKYGIPLKDAKNICDEYLESKKDEKQPNIFKRASNQASYKSEQEPVAFTKKGQEKINVKKRIEENKEQGVACCPKCGSTSLSGNKKGFGIGKAVVGAALTYGIGLVAGNIGAKKVRVTCMNCGYSWKL